LDGVVEQIAANNPDGLACSSFENQLCTGIDDCGCDVCENEILDLYECGSGCPTLSCASSPTENQPTTPSPLSAPLPSATPSVAPTQSPSTLAPTKSAPRCPDELAMLKACGQTQGSCISCISGAYDDLFENKESVSCVDFVVGICPAITTTCDCGNCATYAETVSLMQQRPIMKIFDLQYLTPLSFANHMHPQT
jgi:hypothetical protein